jgi:hypothetical protein
MKSPLQVGNYILIAFHGIMLPHNMPQLCRKAGTILFEKYIFPYFFFFFWLLQPTCGF